MGRSYSDTSEKPRSFWANLFNRHGTECAGALHLVHSARLGAMYGSRKGDLVTPRDRWSDGSCHVVIQNMGATSLPYQNISLVCTDRIRSGSQRKICDGLHALLCGAVVDAFAWLHGVDIHEADGKYRSVLRQ